MIFNPIYDLQWRLAIAIGSHQELMRLDQLKRDNERARLEAEKLLEEINLMMEKNK